LSKTFSISILPARVSQIMIGRSSKQSRIGNI